MTVIATSPALPRRYLTTADLRARGFTEHGIGKAVSEQRLLRVRRGRYVDAAADSALIRAARLGGRLDCVSLLRRHGVFVRAAETTLHIHVSPDASRVPLVDTDVVRHRRASTAAAASLTTPLVEALAQATRCQPRDDAIATLDSAWHRELVDEAAITAVFALLPRRLRRMRRFLDAASESGPETLVRLMLWEFGCEVEVQPRVRGVGRVDLIVDGWLIIECDSRAFHEDWEQQRRDRRRDAAAAELGYLTLRLLAEDILYRPDQVRRRLAATLRGRHRPARSGGRAVAPAGMERRAVAL